jgi:hypothetical protein
MCSTSPRQTGSRKLRLDLINKLLSIQVRGSKDEPMKLDPNDIFVMADGGKAGADDWYKTVL